ncbi:unnamed protein product, partial [Didymodactylos carnosus]
MTPQHGQTSQQCQNNYVIEPEKLNYQPGEILQ